MPKKIGNKPLTEKEHRQWKHVFDKTGSGGAATQAVKDSRKSGRKK